MGGYSCLPPVLSAAFDGTIHMPFVYNSVIGGGGGVASVKYHRRCRCGRDDGMKLKCVKCGYEWDYKGLLAYPRHARCPACDARVLLTRSHKKKKAR